MPRRNVCVGITCKVISNLNFIVTGLKFICYVATDGSSQLPSSYYSWGWVSAKIQAQNKENLSDPIRSWAKQAKLRYSGDTRSDCCLSESVWREKLQIWVSQTVWQTYLRLQSLFSHRVNVKVVKSPERCQTFSFKFIIL